MSLTSKSPSGVDLSRHPSLQEHKWQGEDLDRLGLSSFIPQAGKCHVGRYKMEPAVRRPLPLTRR